MCMFILGDRTFSVELIIGNSMTGSVRNIVLVLFVFGLRQLNGDVVK